MNQIMTDYTNREDNFSLQQVSIVSHYCTYSFYTGLFDIKHSLSSTIINSCYYYDHNSTWLGRILGGKQYMYSLPYRSAVNHSHIKKVMVH